MGRLSKSNVEKFLKGNTDPTDYVLQEKINRYLDFRKIYNKLGQSIKADGAVILVENGKQSYSVINPAISEKEKINNQMLKLEKEISLQVQRNEKNTSQTAPNQPPDKTKGGLV